MISTGELIERLYWDDKIAKAKACTVLTEDKRASVVQSLEDCKELILKKYTDPNLRRVFGD
jgi:glycerol-3-phosphate cytidylyltransferase-like family protein